MKNALVTILACTTLGLAIAPFGGAQAADSGFYLGGSIGQSSIELAGSADFDVPDFDENDFAWKLYGGYNLGLGPIDLGIEGGYVDFGSPSQGFPTPVFFDVDVELTGFNAWGVAALDLGLIDVYGKLGFIAWDGEAVADIEDFGSLGEDDSGTDLGYGLGARFNLGRVSIRGEWESYDIDEVERLDMFSVGLSIAF